MDTTQHTLEAHRDGRDEMEGVEQEAKHTPGPWEWYDFHDASGHDWCLISRTRHVPVVLAGQDNGRITTRDEHGVLRPITKDHPNAHLIAAAPTMLAHLQREENFLASIEGCADCSVRAPEFCEEHWEGYGEICSSRRDAIAAALGKS